MTRRWRSVRAPHHFWVIPDRLMGGEWPEHSWEWLADQGISVLVNLTETRYRDPRFRVYRIPVPEGAAPALGQIRFFCRLVGHALHAEQRVYVHCRTGCGRTGTMLACYLIYRDRMDPQDAMDQVAEVRPCAIASDAQEDAVTRWGHHMRETSYRLKETR